LQHSIKSAADLIKGTHESTRLKFYHHRAFRAVFKLSASCGVIRITNFTADQKLTPQFEPTTSALLPHRAIPSSMKAYFDATLNSLTASVRKPKI
jgi:hypothetical protein